jgi:tetratricopeptide (TPR) repeat protein
VAQLVAKELQAVITPEEKQIINKIPTTSLTALELFQKGRDEHINYWIDNRNREALSNAISFYRSAIFEDSTFGQAYTGLAIAIRNSYWQESWSSREFSTKEHKLYEDSVLYLVDKALTFNQDLEEAYLVRGNYFAGTGAFQEALNEYHKALQINPNYAEAYNYRGVAYELKGQYDKAISDCSKAIEINPEYAAAYQNRAILYYYKRDYEKAWDDVHKAQKLGLEIVPKFLVALSQASGREK